MDKSAISQLQELMISLGETPEFECISQSGPPHQMVFVVRCAARGVCVTGTGRSKKEAKQGAARAALAALGQRDTAPAPPQAANTYVSLLRELCAQYRLPALETVEAGAWGPPHRPQFAVRASVGRHERTATAHTKKAARHLAAEQLYVYLRDCLPTLTADFEEDTALVRAHERVMERFVETRGWRPDMSLRISDYHLALVDSLTPEERKEARIALQTADAATAVRTALEAAGRGVQWSELPARPPLQVLEVLSTCPPLSFVGHRPEDATDAARQFLRLGLDLKEADVHGCVRQARWLERAIREQGRRREGRGGGERRGGGEWEGAGRGGLAVSAVAVSLALLAADQTYSEKRFFKAAQLGNVEEIRKQVEAARRAGGAGGAAGASGSAADRRHVLGWTALMAAAANDRPAAVSELLRLGADRDARDRYAGAAPAAAAAGLHPLEALQRREDEFCPGMNARASFLGWTALHYAALADSVGATRALLEAGADPTLRDHAGRRAGHYARDPGPVKDQIAAAVRRWDQEREARAQEERRRFPLERRLKQYIVGQRTAIVTVAAAVRRKENGWADEEHPLVFLFLGSSGIGKTELAKQLARYLHRDDPAAFIRLDMSEYQEKHEVAKLIGAPPGYVGHEEGGQLTRALAARHDAVVLFDEVDKAHPDVLTVLLQLFDEGRLTDGKGRLIECRNAVFVMTSNLAADEIAQYGLRLRREAEQQRADADETAEPPEVSRRFKDEVVRPILKRHFGRDEFLGRINEIVYFLPFSRQELLTLVQRELGRWAERARARHAVELRWEGGVLGALADGYDVHYGARSIQHEVERRVVNQLAAAAERGELPRGAAVLLTEKQGRLTLHVRQPSHTDYRPLQPP